MDVPNDLRRRGDRHRSAKLTEEAVLEIVRRYFDDAETMTELAHAYGVSPTTIADILHGLTWGHVTGRASR
jgi:transposase-like protein